MDTLSSVTGSFTLELEHFDWSSDKFKATGAYMPDNFLDILRPKDAIFFGAVGDPSVPDHISLWSLLLPMRQRFQQYVNIRPVRVLRGLKSPLSACKPVSLKFLTLGLWLTARIRAISTGLLYERIAKENMQAKVAAVILGSIGKSVQVGS